MGVRRLVARRRPRRLARAGVVTATMHGPGMKIRGLLGVVEARLSLLDAVLTRTGEDEPEERARLEARRAELCAELVAAVGPVAAEDMMSAEAEEPPPDPWSERRDLN